MADGFIQVPTDSTGKKVDTSELTRPDASVVERQRMAIPDGVIVDGDMLRNLLIELRMQNVLLAQAFGINDDLNQLRNDVNDNIL